MPSESVFHRPAYAADMAQQLLKPTALQLQVRSGVFLSGIRRIGKTTFLRQDLIPALESRGALVVYVDLWADRSKNPASLVHEAVKAMVQHGVRRIFITEPNGRLMGLLSIDDLLAHLADELSALSQALRIGIDLESSRTAPMFNPHEAGGMYLAQHEP